MIIEFQMMHALGVEPITCCGRFADWEAFHALQRREDARGWKVYAPVVEKAMIDKQAVERPDGYAYRYPDGYIRHNNGGEVNGSSPIEALPWYYASTLDSLRRQLTAKEREVIAAHARADDWHQRASQMLIELEAAREALEETHMTSEAVPSVKAADQPRDVLLDKSLRERAHELRREACGAWSDVISPPRGGLDQAKCDYAAATENKLRAIIDELADLSGPASAP